MSPQKQLVRIDELGQNKLDEALTPPKLMRIDDLKSIDPWISNLAYESETESGPDLVVASKPKIGPNTVWGTGPLKGSSALFPSEVDISDFTHQLQGVEMAKEPPPDLTPAFIDPTKFDSSDGILEWSPEKMDETRRKGKVGFFESLNMHSGMENWPVVNTVYNPIKASSLMGAQKIIDDPSATKTERDWAVRVINEQIEKTNEVMVRGYTGPGQAVASLSWIPSFMVDMLIGEPYAKAASGLIMGSLKASVRGIVESNVKKAAVRGAGWIAGTTARTGITTYRIPEGYEQNQFESRLQFTDKGIEFSKEAQESPLTSFFKSYGDLWIQTGTEVTGGAIASAITKPVKVLAEKIIPQGVMASLALVYSKVRKIPLFAAARKLKTKAGWDDMIGEFGEEGLANFLSALSGTETFGVDTPKDKHYYSPSVVLDRIAASIPSWEEALVTLGVLAIPGPAIGLTSAALKKISEYRSKSGDTGAVDKLLSGGQANSVAAFIQRLSRPLAGEAAFARIGDEDNKPITEPIVRTAEESKIFLDEVEHNVKTLGDSIRRNVIDEKLTQEEGAKINENYTNFRIQLDRGDIGIDEFNRRVKIGIEHSLALRQMDISEARQMVEGNKLIVPGAEQVEKNTITGSDGINADIEKGAKGFHVRIYDVDSGQTVSITTFPDKAKAGAWARKIIGAEPAVGSQTMIPGTEKPDQIVVGQGRGATTDVNQKEGDPLAFLKGETDAQMQRDLFDKPAPEKRVISTKAYEEAKARFDAEGQGMLFSGIDPTKIPDLLTMGAYHLESGLRNFTDWSKAMISTVPKITQKQLKNVWKAINAKFASAPETEDESVHGWILDRIRNSEAGYRKPVSEEDRTYMGVSSTFPEWFKNKGWTKKETENIIAKVRAGAVLTPKQQAIYGKMFEGAKQEYERYLAGQEKMFKAEKVSDEEAPDWVTQTDNISAGIKNANTDATLASMGRPPASRGEKVGWQEALDIATGLINKNPHAGKQLIDELIGNPRAINHVEVAMLVIEARRAQNNRNVAQLALEKARESGDPVQIKEKSDALLRFQNEYIVFAEVVAQAGRISSYALSFRKMMLLEDYSIERMSAIMSAEANDGFPLDEDQFAEVSAHHKTITNARQGAEQEDARARKEQRELALESEISDLKRELEIERKAKMPISDEALRLAEEYVKRKEDRASAADKELSDLLRTTLTANPVFNSKIYSLLYDIGSAKLARKTLTFAQWSKAMTDQVGERLSAAGHDIGEYLKSVWEKIQKEKKSDFAKVMGKDVPKEKIERVKKEIETEDPRAKVEKALKNISRKVDKGEDFDIYIQARQIAKYYISEGLKTANEVAAAVHAELSEIMDITIEETGEAIAGYGRYTPPSKNEIDIKLADISGQLRQLAKLRALQARVPLKASGKGRHKITDEERILIKQVNEFKKRYGVVVTDPERQLRSALDAVKTRLKNSIADLKYQIEQRKEIVRDKTSVEYDKEALALKKEQDELKVIFNELFGKKKISEERQIALAMKAVEKSIASLEKRLAAGDIGKKRIESKAPLSPALEAARKRRDALQKQMNELRALAKPQKDPDEIASRALETRMRNEIADMWDRIAKGEYTKKEKRQVTYDEKAIQAKRDHEHVLGLFNQYVLEARMEKASRLYKLGYGAIQAFNLSRAIITAIDLSAVLRQGGFIALGNPLRAINALPAMFRAFASAEGEYNSEYEIANRKNALWYKSSELSITKKGYKLADMEEAYMSRWIESFPTILGGGLLRGSQRAYSTFLNRLRADSFDAMVDGLGLNGSVTNVEAKAIANFINVTTGRGNLMVGKTAVAGLSTFFFAPRYVVSRFQLVFLQPLWGGSARTRGLIAREYGKYLGAVGLIYAMSLLAWGDDKDFELKWKIFELDKKGNPHLSDDIFSSDFGKLRFGDTRLDPLSGISQITVFLAREMFGKKEILSTGEVVPTRGEDVAYGGPTFLSILADFFRTKLSPTVGAVVDWGMGTHIGGREVTPWSTAENLFVPLSVKDVLGALEDQGMARGTAISILSIFGMSSQTYDEEKRGIFDRIFGEGRTSNRSYLYGL